MLKNILLLLERGLRYIKLYCDNSSTVFYAKNNKTSSGSKHLELKYLTIKDLVKKNDIVVEYIDTDFMLAGPLTKGLRPIVLNNHVESMGIVSSFDVLVLLRPLCLWSRLVWSSRHGHNFELDFFGISISMVNAVLELRYDFKLGVVWTTVSVIGAILELRHYGL
ncbi:hypothetical protein KIW84_031847 [Lathyrus oleraceus]|uniref:Retrovirus-related Pol polyprotein from transposon TNT 1-94 n=1 Tax=Pisum sativum TaxID=3888 RepID=A0A9D5B149_PEA|nr:hypothetical protein KIW84_031847 [Pisum sativum]